MQRKAPSLRERRIVGRFVRTVFIRDRRGRGWEVPARLAHERVEFEGNTGARVVGRWFPAERSRGAVVLAHPDKRYAQHWFVENGWVDFLHEAGFDVLTFDFTGYGGSTGVATYYHEDLVAAARVAERWAGGLPVHVVGVSMGAFVGANASPFLPFVDGLVLESPYPSFNSWYSRGPYRWAMELFDFAFPRTAAMIQAPANLARAAAKRVLVAWPAEDEVTPPSLSREVADAGPRERTRTMEVARARHLEPFATSAAYRAAVLETLGVPADEARLLAERARPPLPRERKARAVSPAREGVPA